MTIRAECDVDTVRTESKRNEIDTYFRKMKIRNTIIAGIRARRCHPNALHNELLLALISNGSRLLVSRMAG